MSFYKLFMAFLELEDLGVGCFPCGGLHGFLGFLSSNNNGMVFDLLCPGLSMWLAPLVPKLQQQITSVSSKT